MAVSAPLYIHMPIVIVSLVLEQVFTLPTQGSVSTGHGASFNTRGQWCEMSKGSIAVSSLQPEYNRRDHLPTSTPQVSAQAVHPALQ